MRIAIFTISIGKAMPYFQLFLEKAERYPMLWDTNHPQFRSHKRAEMISLLNELNSSRPPPLTMAGLKLLIRRYQRRHHQSRRSSMVSSCFYIIFNMTARNQTPEARSRDSLFYQAPRARSSAEGHHKILLYININIHTYYNRIY